MNINYEITFKMSGNCCKFSEKMSAHAAIFCAGGAFYFRLLSIPEPRVLPHEEFSTIGKHLFDSVNEMDT